MPKIADKCGIKTDSVVFIMGRKYIGKTDFMLYYLAYPHVYYYDTFNQMEFKDIGKIPNGGNSRIINGQKIELENVIKEMWRETGKILIIDECHAHFNCHFCPDWLLSYIAAARNQNNGIWVMAHRPKDVANQSVISLTTDTIIFELKRAVDRKFVEQEFDMDVFARLKEMPRFSYFHIDERNGDAHFHLPVNRPDWLKNV